VELTEGCSLFCDFCGLQGIRERPMQNLKFMSLPTARVLAAHMKLEKWNSRIEFAMHGEPTLNPHFFQIIRIFRDALPKASIMVCSNGSFAKEPIAPVNFVRECSKHGVNILAVDAYEYSKGFWGKVVASLEEAEYPFAWYPDNRDASPHIRSDPIMFRVVMVRDISNETTGTHASLNTHCGAAFPPKTIQEPCGKPFRELSIRWDGSIAICCNDWRGEYVIGNINDQTLSNLWQHDHFLAARRHLLRGLRTFAPCNKCDARTYRPGLLPDQKGKETMNEPGPGDRVVIEDALADGPLTEAVKRIWECTNCDGGIGKPSGIDPEVMNGKAGWVCQSCGGYWEAI
jgi:radical SAM protein with 4Fe4S-binding SPASM domain